MSISARAASACFVASSIAALSSGCIERGYPLGSNGGVELRTDTAGALFAADVLDAEGKGAEPRQKPFMTGVTLTLTEGSEAANGGFVDVRVEPPEALALSTDADEDSAEPTCVTKDGKFLCTATAEGIARFVLTSTGTWSGDANLVVTWSDQRKEQTVEVLPAGLPPTATNFEMIASDLADTAHILPTYTALSCTNIDVEPGDLGSKWRDGNIRAREAFVRATAPATAPGVVASAPVIIESLSSEAALSLSAACADADRAPRLRVLLDDTGQSPPFFVCFSDLGGPVQLSVTSGLLSVTPPPSFDVEPEPRVLRVAALAEEVVLDESVELFEVTAFNTDLERIAMDVDLLTSDASVMKLLQASDTLSGEGVQPTRLVVTPVGLGTAVLHVRPRLFAEPDCTSIPINVIAAP